MPRSDELEFRGMKRRTLEDQKRAMTGGYGSVQEMALDELAALYYDLLARTEALEKRMSVLTPIAHAGVSTVTGARGVWEP